MITANVKRVPERIVKWVEAVNEILPPQLESIQRLANLDDTYMVDVFEAFFDLSKEHTFETINIVEFIKIIARSMFIQDKEIMKNFYEKLNELIRKTRDNYTKTILITNIKKIEINAKSFLKFYSGHFAFYEGLDCQVAIINATKDAIKYGRLKNELPNGELWIFLHWFKIANKMGIFDLKNDYEKYNQERYKITSYLLELYERYYANPLLLLILSLFITSINLQLYLNLDKFKLEHILQIPDEKIKNLMELFMMILLLKREIP